MRPRGAKQPARMHRCKGSAGGAVSATRAPAAMRPRGAKQPARMHRCKGSAGGAVSATRAPAAMRPRGAKQPARMHQRKGSAGGGAPARVNNVIRAVFLDRDGVLNPGVTRDGKPWAPVKLAELEILPGVPEALASLRAAGFQLIVVTNQPDVVRGHATRAGVESICEYM